MDAYIKKFILELKSIQTSLKKIDDKEVFDEILKYANFNALVIPVIDKKFSEFYKENGLEDTSKNKIGYIEDLVDKLLMESELSKMIYDSTEIRMDEDLNEPVIYSESGHILNFFMARVKEENSKINEISHSIQLVTQSALINSCATLENLAFNLLKDIYLNYFNGELIDNKSITFSDLKKFDDIENARIYLIDSELDGTFRKGFIDWFEILKKRLNIDEKKFEKFLHIQDLKEIYQRRNLFVHCDGVVNDYYLKNVDKKYINGIEKGDRIGITSEYIESCISKIRNFGWILYYNYICLKNNYEHEKVFGDMNNILIENIYEKCDAIPFLFNYMGNQKSTTDGDKLLSTFNYFLYFKMINDWDEKKQELEGLDVSIFDIQYKMAKSILLDDKNGYKYTKEFLENQSDEDFLFYYDWPLFSLIKSKNPYKKYFSKRLKNVLGISIE